MGGGRQDRVVVSRQGKFKTTLPAKLGFRDIPPGEGDLARR